MSMTFLNPQANYAFRFFHTSEKNSLLEIPLETAEFRGTCDRLDTGARNKKPFSPDLRPLAFCSVAGHLLRLSLTRDTEEPFCGPWGGIICHIVERSVSERCGREWQGMRDWQTSSCFHGKPLLGSRLRPRDCILNFIDLSSKPGEIGYNVTPTLYTENQALPFLKISSEKHFEHICKNW